MEKKSPQFTLNKTDYRKLLKDIAFYSIVPATFYLTAVLGAIQQPEHVISLMDFVPSNATVIAIVAWVLNQILNALRKFVS